MPFVVAALVLVGSVTVLNLALTMAVIRRLRKQGSVQIVQGFGDLPSVGSTIPSFEAETVDSDWVSRDTMSGAPGVLAFFSTDCSACKPSIPYLRDYVAEVGLNRAQVIAVVSGETGKAQDFRADLGGIAMVVSEPKDGPITKEFGIPAFPTFVMVDQDGKVVRTSAGARSLLENV